MRPDRGHDDLGTEAGLLLHRREQRADHLARLVDDLLDLQRLREGRASLAIEPHDLPGLVEEAARRDLRNVAFVDPVPKRDVPSWLARADACLLPYQDKALFALSQTRSAKGAASTGSATFAGSPP